MTIQKITPFLWFCDDAEKAVTFYTGLFNDSRVCGMTHYREGGPGPVGQVMTIDFELFGQPFIALNGGPLFEFSPAVSFLVSCDTQEEVDLYWDALLEGGTAQQCGWLTDKFGLTWQIVPRILGELLGQEDQVKSRRVMEAMFQMVKLDISALKRASEPA